MVLKSYVMVVFNSQGLKKPYNPIIGETYRCMWLHQKTNSKTFYIAEQVTWAPEEGILPDINLIDQELIPPVSHNSHKATTCYKLTTSVYVYFQVSHHPPVSAFYVSNRKDGFCLSGSILAKSKFYGAHTLKST